MQKPKEVRSLAELRWCPFLFVSRNTLLLLLVILGSSTLLYADLTLPERHGVPPQPAAATTLALNGASQWLGNRKVTVPTFDFSVPGPQAGSVSPLFARYYNHYHGTQSLGAALTVAFPTTEGWMQFFASGALLLPVAERTQTLDADNLEPQEPLTALIQGGVKDPDTGIIRLPLLQTLLTVGSLAPVGGDGSLLTYVDLRKATDPALMQQAVRVNPTATSSHSEIQAIFIKGGTRAGKDVGHLVPLPFWHYINRVDISPGGWEQDFGAPLTEALSFTITWHGSIHRMLVQAYLHDGLVLDQSIQDASGQPQIKHLDTGLAYLRTLGPPSVAIYPHQPGWVQEETALFALPDMGKTVAHVGQHFPLTLLGDTIWKRGMLWCHVQWAAAKRKGTAWVPVSAINLTPLAKVPGWASFDVLSPDLAAYLEEVGDNVGAVVYDVTGQHYYTYHADSQFIMGSSIKVPIMLAFLDMTERKGRQPNGYEMALLTTMIENSNNDSAAVLYYNEIGGAAGITSYLRGIGIAGVDPDSSAFGWSLITPLAMVNLLRLLHDGKILTAHDRDLALFLMKHIEADQRFGVGDSAPITATVAMKDGWVTGPDSLWAINSSGIVTLGRQTYIIAVYMRGQGRLEDGWAIVQHVCATVASLLI